MTKLGNNGLIVRTFSMGELLIAVLLMIIIIILLANMGN